MWSSSILWAVFGKEKSPETFCFKTFSVVEATGLEPTTFWSLTKRATKLRYASIYAILRTFPPNNIAIILFAKGLVKHFYLPFLNYFNFFHKSRFFTYRHAYRTCTRSTITSSQRISPRTPLSATGRKEQRQQPRAGSPPRLLLFPSGKTLLYHQAKSRPSKARSYR